MSDMRRLGPGKLGRTRAFVKVQDGCDNHCTFCITTIARGEGRSRPVDQIVAEVQGLAAAGYQEVVLSGVHMGSYGRDRGEIEALRHLIEALLRKTDVPRLRLSSLEPWDLSPGLFDLWADARLCRQLHLPLQSGCDATLQRMARRTTTDGFAQLVAAARARIPDLALTTDVMVGFPGETDADFRASYDFVQAMEFARLHVFPFSARPGTPAARMPGQVPTEPKNARARAMRHQGAKQERAFHTRFLGRTLPVLWETSRADGLWRGHTDNYLTVTTRCATSLSNRIRATRLVATAGQGLRGQLVDQ
jgi:threonylcarbamoyladenosine tRNA methylthiotransferase MtaB